MKFAAVFGHQPDGEVFAPGRINLIGEHIDYCGGEVLPMAIASGTRITYAWQPAGQRIDVFSGRFSERITLDANQATAEPGGHWSDYVVGVLKALGGVTGSWKLHVEQDIAAGGLSSSASFTVALALLFSGAGSPDDEERIRLARLCQTVENDFIGVNCGIMDQMSVIMGGVIRLDCSSLAFQRVAGLSPDVTLVVLDTGVPRTLAASAYNERVQELDQIAAITATSRQRLAVTDYKGDLPSDLIGRYRHVTSEHARVKKAAAALESENWVKLGELMNESHESLACDYAVSCEQLDRAVALARDCPGVHGARMTGAGFGGCAIILADTEHVGSWRDQLASDYQQATGIDPTLFIASPGEIAFRRYG